MGLPWPKFQFFFNNFKYRLLRNIQFTRLNCLTDFSGDTFRISHIVSMFCGCLDLFVFARFCRFADGPVFLVIISNGSVMKMSMVVMCFTPPSLDFNHRIALVILFESHLGPFFCCQFIRHFRNK